MCYGNCFLNEHVFSDDTDEQVPVKQIEKFEWIFIVSFLTDPVLRSWQGAGFTYHQRNDRHLPQFLTEDFFQPPEALTGYPTDNSKHLL